jgi:hypothetical protein
MRPRISTRFKSSRTQAVIAAASLVLAGCSSSPSNTGAPAPASQSTESKTTAKGAVTLADNTPVAASVFKIDQNSRDPFFPKAKRAVETTEPNRQAPVQVDVAALLQQGFQGVIGDKDTRIALINNVMLEPGRQTVIPINAPGQSRSIPVRCREVLRDAVILEVQGYPEPLRLVRRAYN